MPAVAAFDGKQIHPFLDGNQIRLVQSANPAPDMSTEKINELGNRNPAIIENTVNGGTVTLDLIKEEAVTIDAILTGQKIATGVRFTADDFVPVHLVLNRKDSGHGVYKGCEVMLRGTATGDEVTHATDAKTTQSIPIEGDAPIRWEGLAGGSKQFAVGDFTGSGPYTADFTGIPSAHVDSGLPSSLLLYLEVDGVEVTPDDSTVVLNVTPTAITNPAGVGSNTGGFLDATADHFFRIQGFDAQNREVGLSSEIPDPVGLTAGNLGSVALSWDTVSGATKYRIYYTATSGDYSEQALVVATVTTLSYTVTSVATLSNGKIQANWAKLSLDVSPVVDAWCIYLLDVLDYPYVAPNWPMDARRQ